MGASKLELMHDHIRAIHRALTGNDLPPPPLPPEPLVAPSIDEVVRAFAELETLARSLPYVAERVPPFCFTPPLDLLGTEREMIIELGVPGVERGGVEVDLQGERLMVWGARSIDVPFDGCVYFHAELPRGLFRREVRLPGPGSGRPRVEVENGIVRVRVAKPAKSSLPQA
jgi:HSP20 family molecular chaperone IbpA